MTARLLLVDDHNLFRTGLRLIVQDHPRVGTIAEARGADGFLPKSASAEDILEAISCALSGQPCFPINSGNSATTRGPDTPSLTARQLDVLSLLCTGKPNKVIARDLGLSENTVRVHVAAIFAQLGVNSRSAALLAAQRLGLSTPQLHDSL
jgi:DNA-binding NarL/FixJ family response regulator